MQNIKKIYVIVLVLVLVSASCGGGGGDGSSAATDDAQSGGGQDESVADSKPDADSQAMAEGRCENNRSAGTITFVTGFDFAASAGIVDAIVADAEGYFEQLCIDVDLQPGFSPSNGALVLEGQAQFGTAGSFAELVANNIAADGGDLVAVLHWGRTSIEALVVPEGSDIADFADLCGSLIGIKGDLPYSLQAAVALAGVERDCFEEILLDGFDPVTHLALDIDALPVYKSNEPHALEAAGVPFSMLDPQQFHVPSSFGIVFTTRRLIDEHPGLVQDMVRALIRGQAFAAANPDAAVEHAFDLINAVGNPMYLAMDVERNRWEVESGLITDLAPSGAGVGIPDTDLLEAEIDAMTQAGVFDRMPDWKSMVDADIADSVYDGTELQWSER